MTASQILAHYESLLNIGSDHAEEIGRVFPIPQFSDNILDDLCSDAIDFLKTQPIHLDLNGNIYIVGDIHGNLYDLFRIFYASGPPPQSRFLFLGDYVDRGEFSLEVITLLVSLMISYPESIYLLRGNHEFASVNKTYGFYEQMMTKENGEALWCRFQEIFAWLPLTAVVNNTSFCVHGGISPTFPRIRMVVRFQRPINDYSDPTLTDLLWSDPTTFFEEYGLSKRGTGNAYGTAAVNEFLTANGMERIIRAHQCVFEGIEEFNGGKVITVFSTSYYSHDLPNKCGLLHMNEDGALFPIILEAHRHPQRNDFTYKQVNSLNKSLNPAKQENLVSFRSTPFASMKNMKNMKSIVRPVQSKRRSMMFIKEQFNNVTDETKENENNIS